MLNPVVQDLPAPLLQMETLFRQLLLQAGLKIFGPLLQQRVDQIDAAYQAKPQSRRHGRRSLEVSTLFGQVTVLRDYYHGPDGGHCPADALLGLEGSTTPALARLVCRAAAQQPDGAASRDLAEYGSIQVEERQIQRVVQQIGPACEPWLASLPSTAKAVPILYVTCDGTGAPTRKKELQGRKGRQEDGSAKTREVKLGAVFTQHKVDVSSADKPLASRWIKLLLKDQVAKFITQAKELQGAMSESTDPDDNLGFLERHQHRMKYGSYRKKGWFIGSGVIEAGCKNVVGKRLKQSGMFCSEFGATCVLNFRTLLLSQRFDAFWKHRHNVHAAKNDCLPLAA